MQEYSKPNNKQVIPDSNIEDILKRILQIIDNTNYDNHNVRSRNGKYVCMALKFIATFLGGDLTFIPLSALKVRLNGQQKKGNLSCNIAAN